MLIMRRYALVPVLCACALFLQTPVSAVNFYDGIRAPKGHYLLTYSAYYTADKYTDSEGVVNHNDYDYAKFEEILRYCYYSPDLVLTAMFAAGNVHSGVYHMSSEGIGDINLGIGHFLPVRQADILPALFVKLRNGKYDAAKTVNYGTNQYDIKPMVFFYRQWGRYSLDAVAKYYFRLENPATKVSPGDEIYVQFLPGAQLTKLIKAGPSFNWMQSSAKKINGEKVSASRRESFSAGADVYVRTPVAGVTFTYLRDVYSKNTTRGDFFQIKTTFKF